MTMYKCDQCSYSTTIKANYTRHLNRKRPCRQTRAAQTGNSAKPKFQCLECGEHLDNKASLLAHRCGSSPCDTTEDDCTCCSWCNRKFQHRSSRYRHERVCVKHVPSTVINNNNNITQNNNINVNNNIINVIPFDKIIQDISTGDYTQHLSEEQFAKAIRDSNDIIKTIFIELFLNPKHPERHSLYLTNQRDGPCYTVDKMGEDDGTKYMRMRPIRKVTEQVIDGVTSMVDINMDEVEHGASENKVNHHQNTIYMAGNYRPCLGDQDMVHLTAAEQAERIKSWDKSHQEAVRGYNDEITATLHRKRKMLRTSQQNDPQLTV